MRILGFNGSPRKAWNTARLLEKALEGAASRGASTSLAHLYDLDFKGCRSCFGCKIKGGPSYGSCASLDGLTPVLEQVRHADALLLGSPIYFWAITGEMKSFLERLLFPYYRYVKADDPVQTLFPRRIPVGFIYTLGANEARMRQFGYDQAIGLNEMFLRRAFGPVESLESFDTWQFEDYSRIDQDRFDLAAKRAWREEQFPKDLENAFQLGIRLAEGKVGAAAGA
jgi:multimeric flavodoxin WrbA